MTAMTCGCPPSVADPRMTTKQAMSLAGIAGMAVAETKPGTRRFYIFGGARCPAQYSYLFYIIYVCVCVRKTYYHTVQYDAYDIM